MPAYCRVQVIGCLRLQIQLPTWLPDGLPFVATWSYRSVGPHRTQQLTLTLTLTVLTLLTITINGNLSLFLHINYAITSVNKRTVHQMTSDATEVINFIRFGRR